MRRSVLVTGGAGYIGSHVALALLDGGWPVTVVDDLSTGVRALVPAGAEFVEGDIGETGAMVALMHERRIGAVMHFAGSTVVPESLTDPLKYYRNNASASRNLIEACQRAGVRRFIFSSTAAVYGDPEVLPVGEDAEPHPITPYGRSKLAIEWMLRDVGRLDALRHVALRYFNVAGADPLGRSGQSTPNATHLIKVACEAMCGRRPRFEVYGTDYDTPDGTCIRDFIHVGDLADAHIAALRYLEAGGPSQVLNCGYGRGFSVRQVVAAVEAVAGRPLAVSLGPRRPGDIVAMLAATDRIRGVLGWRPRLDDLNAIVASALAWEMRGQPAAMLVKTAPGAVRPAPGACT